MRDKDKPPTQQWRLVFNQEPIWTALPEKVRVSCRDLLVQLIEETLKRRERRDNERQN
jgi:hypothetical protein